MPSSRKKKCFIRNCGSGLSGQATSFFRLPVKDENRLAAFLEFNGDPLLRNLPSAKLLQLRICDLHFEEKFIYRLPRCTKLTYNAIPTLCRPPPLDIGMHAEPQRNLTSFSPIPQASNNVTETTTPLTNGVDQCRSIQNVDAEPAGSIMPITDNNDLPLNYETPKRSKINDMSTPIIIVPSKSIAKKVLLSNPKSLGIRCTKMAPSSSKYPCGHCDSEVSDRSASIYCDGFCEKWFHRECENISKKDFDAICKCKGLVKWFCRKCSIELTKFKSRHVQ
uniref:PHD-type domain-containing protein n=2 Tax=Lygus hesperus TaxID=30085 RepID=A0A0A9XA95_LYGHE